MEGKEFVLKAKCGEGSRLYGAVTSIDIAKSIAQAGYDVDKRGITISGNIKNLGRFQAQVRLHTQVTANITVHVVSAD